jgi:hypothetical protein
MPGSRRPLYFDVKGLLDEQIKRLDARHPGTSKRVMLRDGAQEAVRVPQVKWADELQIFYQADINKAALRGAYAVDSAALPGGLVRRTYTRRTKQSNAPVTRLVVLAAGADAQEIEATIEQHNPLFDTHKELKFFLRQNQLTSYEVRGSQKLILFDTLRYAAVGQVEQPAVH